MLYFHFKRTILHYLSYFKFFLNKNKYIFSYTTDFFYTSHWLRIFEYSENLHYMFIMKPPTTNLRECGIVNFMDMNGKEFTISSNNFFFLTKINCILIC